MACDGEWSSRERLCSFPRANRDFHLQLISREKRGRLGMLKFPRFSRCFRARRSLFSHLLDRHCNVTMLHTWISGVRDNVTEIKAVI